MIIVEEPLDELYFQWLYRQVAKAGTNGAKTHWKLLRMLYKKEFVWQVPNDDNRCAEGIELRWVFVAQSELSEVDASWMNEPCSVLEMLMALSGRLAFIAEGEARDWFWVLMRNLGLEEHVDHNFDGYISDIDEKLDILIWRRYHPDGRGGLFPLKNATEDQRRVEIWYQMSNYLYEQS